MPRGARYILCAVIAASFAVSGALAQGSSSPGKTILVLDASGSMWARVDGQPKIVIARHVIEHLLDTLPASESIGLVAYGHRRKGDCTDIQTLVPPAPDTRNAIRAAVESISPKGKTPLSAAVSQAAEALKYEENKATVILVSDGRETCHRDPCAVGKQLEQTGVDFTADVVGFDVSGDPKALSQLRCLAKTTGGRFFTAANAQQLSNALRAVSKPPPKPVKTDVRFEATDGKGGQTITRGLVWALTNQKTGKALVLHFKVDQLRMSVTPGAYKVRVMRPRDGARAERVVNVSKQGQQTFVLALVLPPPKASVSAAKSAPAGATIPVTWKGPNKPDDYIAVVKVGADRSDYINAADTSKGSPAKLRMPAKPGNYEIRYVQHSNRAILAKRRIAVTEVKAMVSAVKRAPAGSAIAVKWKGPAYPDDYITVVKVGADHMADITDVDVRERSPAKLRLPPKPGQYEIRYIQHEGYAVLARQPIVATKVTATLSAPKSAAVESTIPVTWTGPNYPDDYITIVEVGADHNADINDADTSRGSPAKLDMPDKPGPYEIRYMVHLGHTILTRRPITVTKNGAVAPAPNEGGKRDAASRDGQAIRALLAQYLGTVRRANSLVDLKRFLAPGTGAQKALDEAIAQGPKAEQRLLSRLQKLARTKIEGLKILASADEERSYRAHFGIPGAPQPSADVVFGFLRVGGQWKIATEVWK